MAFTKEEEATLRKIINSYNNAKTIEELRHCIMGNNYDKLLIEVQDTANGWSGHIALEEIIQLATPLTEEL